MNPYLLGLIPAVILGCLNGYYWNRRGYKGWHLYYLGTIVFFCISVMIINFFR